MTRTLQTIEHYIKTRKESMNHCYNWMMAREDENEYEKRNYIERAIKEELYDGRAVIRFMNIYMQELSDENYNRLDKELDNAYDEIYNKVWFGDNE